MPAFDVPLLQSDDADDADDAKARSEEVRMRLALEKLGTRSTPTVRSRPGSAAGTGHSAPRARHKFAREGDVPVERMPVPVRSPADLQRELTEERAGRQRTEQALATAQTQVSTLQAALSRSEQATRAAREAVEEREAAMAGLRAELQRAQVELKAAADARAAARVGGRRRRSMAEQAKAAQGQGAAGATDPQPVRWWLPLMQPRSGNEV